MPYKKVLSHLSSAQTAVCKHEQTNELQTKLQTEAVLTETEMRTETEMQVLCSSPVLLSLQYQDVSELTQCIPTPKGWCPLEI